MRIDIRHLAVSLICPALVLGITACSSTKSTVYAGDPPVMTAGPPPHAPAHGYRAKHTYYYYPQSHVYFDINRGVYFYIDNDEWRMATVLPLSLSIKLGDHVTIAMDSDKPYLSLQEHQKKYPPGQAKKAKM